MTWGLSFRAEGYSAMCAAVEEVGADCTRAVLSLGRIRCAAVPSVAIAMVMLFSDGAALG